jgi:type II secretory pathway pseudopilin PulG
VVATLHSGFHFGLNVHTLAYALTLLVVLSGVFGVAVYAILPKALAASREELTQPQMVDALRAIDRQLDEAAQPLRHDDAEWVVVALAEQPFKDGLRARLAGGPRRSATRVALAMLGERDGDGPRQRVAALLARRLTQLERIRHQQRLRALLEVWLYIHLPATVALLAALSAHVISEFYYW